jgi:hypothetical protein
MNKLIPRLGLIHKSILVGRGFSAKTPAGCPDA